MTAAESVNEEAVEAAAWAIADYVGETRFGYEPHARAALAAAVPHLERRIRESIAGEDVWAEVAAERARAHAKHGGTSMEAQPVDALLRLAILMEEVGEVAKEFNEARHNGTLDLAALRKELIQTAAMAGGWADAIGPVSS